MDQKLKNINADLDDVAALLASSFVDRDEVVEMLLLGAIAQEHVLLLGPPGTGKSELVKNLARLICREKSEDSEIIPYFEYLLTRFSEPNEIFGPVDIQGFQSGAGYRRLPAGLLPRAEIAFLDEIFKAGSAILNALLTILNERIYYNAGRPEPVPLRFLVGAANQPPEDPELEALYDRFALRLWSEQVDESNFPALLQRGWELERRRIRDGRRSRLAALVDSQGLEKMHATLGAVSLDQISVPYQDLIFNLRRQGIGISDRRAVKILKLIAAAALRRGSLTAQPADFKVLRHCWNRREELAGIEELLTPFLSAEISSGRQRHVARIGLEVEMLAQSQPNIRGDLELADFLSQADKLRRELGDQPREREAQRLLGRLEALIEKTLENLESEN